MENMKKSLKIFKMIHKLDSRAMLYSIFLALFTVLKSYIPIGFMSIMLNALTSNATQTYLTQTILWYLVVVAVVYSLAALFKKLDNDSRNRVSLRLNAALTRKSMVMKYDLLTSPEVRLMYQRAEEGSNSSGGIQSFITEVTQSLLTIAISVVISGASLIALLATKSTVNHVFSSFTDSIWYGVIIITLMIIPMIASLNFSKRNAGIMFKMFEENTMINREFGYYISTIISNEESGKLIRLYRGFDLISKIIHESSNTITINFRKHLKKISHFNSLGQIITILCMGVVYVMIGMKALTGAILIGTVLFNVNLIQNMVDKLVNGLSRIASFTNLVDFLRYYAEYLELEEEESEGVSLPEKPFTLEFENVSYVYPGSDTVAIKHLNLSISMSEVCALVGKNGSGKTTLVKLICRLIAPSEGTIYLNGVDIQTIDLEAYRSLLSVVFQDFRMFAYSVEENVSVSKVVNQSQLDQALKDSNAYERVQRLPQQAKTSIKTQFEEDGVELSGGEAQKVAMARAWYKDAPMIILDEPTAALDPMAEFEMYRDFNQKVKDKGALVISHRMSSCRFCERILVFDEGALIQEGDHDALMQNTEGLYHELFTAQAHYYQ